MSKPFLKNILAAVNGSQSSMQAVMYGIIMAKQYNLNLKIVYVVDTATVKFLASSNFFVDEEKDYYLESLRKDGKTYLNYAENLAKSKGLVVETELREGSVWSEIIKSADESNTDMILIGGHENNNMISGSIENRKSFAATARSEIAAFAHCPVLIIHKPEIEALFKIS